MLSYMWLKTGDYVETSRSPRQLWNALLRSLSDLPNLPQCRSPRQLWNALLRKTIDLNA